MKESLFQCREPLPQGAAVALAADRLYLALGKFASLSWAAVKELKLLYYPPIMENQMEKKMENDMETRGNIGI